MHKNSRAERRSPRRAAACALVTIALGGLGFGCEDGSGLGVVRPELALDPEPMTLDFGQAMLGRTGVDPRIIRVTNAGDAVLVIEDVRIQGEDAGVFFVSTAPKSLAPSASNEIWIRFEPEAQGTFQASLSIRTNDPMRRSVAYDLIGGAREPCSISVTPPHSRLLLGQIQKLTVQANGGVDCKITRLFTDATLFPFVSPPELPFVIPTGTSRDLEVQHSAVPSQPGVPIREVLVRESEGQEVRVTLEGEPPVFGCVSVFPERLIFDETPIGEVSTRAATVRNACARDVFVTSARVTVGVYYYAVEPGIFPLRIPPLGSVDVPVTYSPFSDLGDDGTLLIGTNDAATPSAKIDLFGRAAVPNVAYFPSTLDFGTVAYRDPRPDSRSECSSNARFVQVYNQGSTDLRISSLELDPARDGHFEVTGVDVGGAPITDFASGFTVAPGRDAKISLQFAPTRVIPADHRSTLSINHNAAGTPAKVELVGHAAPAGDVHDSFTQLSGPMVDILWVIDDSCSMSDEQARLAANLSHFVDYADMQGADYQMAVVTTDGHSPYSGVFEMCLPHPRIISSRYADAATRNAAFACLFDVGVNGSGIEAGLAAARNALVRAQSTDQNPLTNRNAGFLRADAKLAVVVMSDEDDQSDEGDQLLRDYFLSVKGFRRDQVRVHAIAGPVSEPCERGPRQSEPGYRYYWMTQETGGIYLNICLEDWQPVLQRLGLETFTPLDEWALSEAADPGTLSVTVGGRPVPLDPANGFTFDSERNTVKLHGAAVPAPGVSVGVDYSGLCRP